MIIKLLEEQNISIIDLAKELDISTSQIYKWNREGISINNKYYNKLQRILPGLKPKEPTLRKNGNEDRRYNSGRKKYQNHATLQETDIKQSPEKEFTSTLFPKITMKNKN